MRPEKKVGLCGRWPDLTTCDCYRSATSSRLSGGWPTSFSRSVIVRLEAR